MKTTFIYTVIFSCFFLFSSCASDDNSQTDNSELQAQLQGLWLYEGLTINGEDEESPVEVGDIFYDFKAGGTFVVNDEAGSISGTYLLVGNDLTLRIDGENDTYKITKLTTNVLDLFATVDADEEEGLDEVTFHLSRN